MHVLLCFQAVRAPSDLHHGMWACLSMQLMANCTGNPVGMVRLETPMKSTPYYGLGGFGTGGLDCRGIEEFLDGDIKAAKPEEAAWRKKNAIREVIGTRCRWVIVQACTHMAPQLIMTTLVFMLQMMQSLEHHLVQILCTQLRGTHGKLDNIAV